MIPTVEGMPNVESVQIGTLSRVDGKGMERMDGLLLQGVLGFQMLECLIDLLKETRFYLQPVVAGTESGHRQGGYSMY